MKTPLFFYGCGLFYYSFQNEKQESYTVTIAGRRYTKKIVVTLSFYIQQTSRTMPGKQIFLDVDQRKAISKPVSQTYAEKLVKKAKGMIVGPFQNWIVF